MYECKESGCEEKFDDVEEYQVHSSYHAYHRKIRDLGRNELESLKIKFRVNIVCPIADRVDAGYNFPQLPTKLVCGWTGCHQQFLSVDQFYDHVAEHAHRLVDKCYWYNCNKEMKAITPSLLRDHLRTHTVQKLYACPQCGNLFSTKIKFYDHFLRHVQNPNFLISPNNTEIQDKIIIETYNVDSNYNVKLYRCRQSNCDKAFLSSSLVCEHLRTHSTKNQCDQCPFVAKTKSRLESHKLYKHQDARSFQCTICDKGFKQRGDLRAHVKRHQIVLFKCDKCDFESHTEEGFNRHSRMHDKNHDYFCHVCNKIFSRGSNLSRHLTTQHEYTLPDGQSKFKYRLISKGLYVLDTGDDDQIQLVEKPSL